MKNGKTDFGMVTGRLVGIAMKEAIRRAIGKVHALKMSLEVNEKETTGKKKDFVTSADIAAQEVYVDMLSCFPDYGIVAEEHNLMTAPNKDCRLYFSIDPVDGTKALIREQSHGIGTMLALAEFVSGRGKVLAAFVGDVMTHEVYGFSPGSEHVHRVSKYETPQRLTAKKRPLAEQYILLRDAPDDYSPFVQTLVRRHQHGGCCENIEVSGGSIGLAFARLWKGEIGGLLLQPGSEKPWDIWPVIGICEKMGFVFLAHREQKWMPFSPQVLTEDVHWDFETLVVHMHNVHEIGAWEHSAGY